MINPFETPIALPLVAFIIAAAGLPLMKRIAARYASFLAL